MLAMSSPTIYASCAASMYAHTPSKCSLKISIRLYPFMPKIKTPSFALPFEYAPYVILLPQG